MGIAKGPLILSNKPTPTSSSSMSHDYHHHGIFTFSNGTLFDKSNSPTPPHLIRPDKLLRVDSFSDPLPPSSSVVDIDHHHHHHHQQQQQQQQFHHVYAATPSGGTMLSDMFNFPPSPSAAAPPVEFSDNFRTLRPPNSASPMHLFLMNPPPPPPPPRSPSPPSTSSTLHMLLPNPPTANSLQGFDGSGVGDQAGFGQFAVVESQGLSLSLHSSSLQHLEDAATAAAAAAKADEFRIRDGGILYNYNNVHHNHNHHQVHGGGGGGGGSGSTSSILQYSFRNNSDNSPQSFQGSQMNPNHQVQIGFGSSLGVVNVLRNSKYVKAAQELLDEFCSVGRVQLKKNKFNTKQNPNPETTATAAASSSSSKEQPPLSAADRIEHQRRKVKLLSMLDEARI